MAGEILIINCLHKDAPKYSDMEGLSVLIPLGLSVLIPLVDNQRFRAFKLYFIINVCRYLWSSVSTKSTDKHCHCNSSYNDKHWSLLRLWCPTGKNYVISHLYIQWSKSSGVLLSRFVQLSCLMVKALSSSSLQFHSKSRLCHVRVREFSEAPFCFYGWNDYIFLIKATELRLLITARAYSSE